MLILSSHLLLGLPSGLFPSGFPTKKPCLHLSFPTYILHAPSISSRFDHPNNTWWEVYFIKFLIILFSPLPCYLIPLRPKYFPQHPILKHARHTFLPQRKRKRFTPTQNIGQNYSSVYLNLYIVGSQTGRRKILHRMIASVPWLQSTFNLFRNRNFIR